jgi:Mg-chelatase subunit ChlD
MKKQILLTLTLVLFGSQLFAAARAADTARPAKAEAKSKPRIEVCFVLDTTGSMSGLIEGAKQKIWSIANEMVSAKPTPDLRFGLVAYRDRGDQYITKLFDLTNDIDAVYANLQGFRADGGGDMPESVNQALHEAVTKMSWSQDRQVLKIIFLVGDSPPHMDYADDVKYPEVCQLAAKRDLIINTVQCGNTPQTTPVWQEIAKLAEGSYAAIAQSGGMVAMATPMDAELATLNRKLGGTLVAYGGETVRRSVAAKQIAAEAAPASVAADRLYFNVTAGVTVQGEGELLDSLANGKLKLADVAKDHLPTEMQKLSEAELKSAVEKKQKERAELQAQIAKLAKQREEYLTQERQRLAAAGKADSFDEKVGQTIRAQAAKKGIEYGK